MSAKEAIARGGLVQGAARIENWRTGRSPYEEKAKIILDIANKKRNTSPCFEVGYVSGSLLIVGGYYHPSAPRFTNYSRTLS